MKTVTSPPATPASLIAKLTAVRRRDLLIRLLNGALRTAAILLGAMLLAMLIDWLVGWFSPTMRFLFTFLALGAAGTALTLWCLRPLLHRRSLASTAQSVDEALPELQERWSTVTELTQTNDPPEIRGSEAMIQKVVQETEATDSTITPETVISSQPLRLTSRWFIAAAAALFLLFALNFSQAKVLLLRFWLPGQPISLSRVQAPNGNLVVPIDEPVTLTAQVEGRIRSGSTRVLIRPTADQPGQEIPMVLKPDEEGAFVHSIKAIKSSFDYRIRSGDGQTPWYNVTAVDRPKISQVKLQVLPPVYSKLPKEEKDSLPHRLRILEGSELQVSFQSDQPLNQLLLTFADGQETELAAGEDNWYHFQTRPTNHISFTAVLRNQFELENKIKPSCRITVYEDLPPAVRIVEPTEDIAARPDATVKIAFEAIDDFGIAQANLIVSPQREDGTSEPVVIPIPLDDQTGNKEISKEFALDLEQFGLKQGEGLSYVVQVTDSKDNPGQTSATPNPASPETQTQEQVSTPSQSSNPAQNQAQSENQPADPSSNPNSPPSNEMARRNLDVAGQSAACQPRNISIDEWASTFDGERRLKQELAIDPILKELAEHLAQAQAATDPVKDRARSDQGLSPADDEPLKVAKDHLTDSDQAIADLKTKTAGTPYAFIGLQLHNIGEAHISPARQNLAAVALNDTPAPANADHLDKASFHIQRARDMLAELTQTYDTAKRDNKLADSMEKLNKMYQVFLEDSQALLGSTQPPINSFDRKTAEVDEEYVNKLKELLEEKKQITAELAKLLAEDPRLLRRYLAMLQLQGTTHRDQLTLLHEQQKQLSAQVADWNSTPPDKQPELISQLRSTYAQEQANVVKDATTLHENMQTWLPLDIEPDHPKVKALTAKTLEIIRLASQSAAELSRESSAAALDTGRQALDQLHALHEELPSLNNLAWINAKLSAYTANRIEETEKLITAHSASLKIIESLQNGDFPKIAEITQHRITQETVALQDKLKVSTTQLSSVSEEITQTADELTRLVQEEIISRQTLTVEKLELKETQPAQELQTAIGLAFDTAETTFDKLIELIIAELDAAPPPTDPGGNQTLDDLLAMLQDEAQAAEKLGIPCRPVNVSILRDWTRPSQASSQGQGQAQAQAQAHAAQAQARLNQAQAERLQREANQAAKQAHLEDHKKDPTQPDATHTLTGPKPTSASWNTLVSKLEKDLLQSRDNVPPEQYRQAIDSYFRIISEKIPRSGE